MPHPHGAFRFVALAALILALPFLAVAQSAGHLYVTLPDNNAIAVVDTSTNTTVSTIQIPTATYPTAVAVTPDSKFAYVVNSGSINGCNAQSVSVLDITANSPTYDTILSTINIGMGMSPASIAISSDGTRAYVANFCDGSVSVINTATRTVLATIPVNAGPESVAFNAHDGLVYVAEGTNLDVINSATNVVTSEGSVLPSLTSPGVDGLAVTPDGKRLYASSLNGGNFYVYNLPLSSGSLAFGAPLGTACEPSAPVVAPNGGAVYITDLECASLIAIDPNSFNINYVTGAPPDPLEPENTMSVAVTPDSSLAYIGGSFFMGQTGRNISGLLAINGSTLALPSAATLALNDLPTGMNFSPINTPAGNSITAMPMDLATGAGPVSVTFSNVAAAGYTALTISSTGPAAPSGVTLGTPLLYYNLITSAQYPLNVPGSINVCVNYSGITLSGGMPALFQFGSGAWTNVTSSSNPQASTVCGAVSSLSTFAVFEAPDPNYTIGGSVSGLSGSSVTLLDNGADALTVSANGPFTFAKPLSSGASYSVTVGTQPANETCTVSAGAGSVGSANVTGVTVSCTANTYTIGGVMSGLSGGASAKLLDNGTDALTVSANGSFTFATRLVSGASYSVTVGTQPANETCSVSAGSGSAGSANVTGVMVSCSANTYTIGGSVSGLNSGASVTLQDNGADTLTVSGNGTFTFATRLVSGASYNATVSTQPSNETCTVTGGTGTVASANVSNVAVSCAAVTPPPTTGHSIGGVVFGLHKGASLTLLDNGADSLAISGDGPFVFKGRVPAGSWYHVTVGAQPANENCRVSNGEGKVGSWNVSSVRVECWPTSYNVHGMVSGLSAGNSVTLLNNGADSLTVTSNGAFTFHTPLPMGTPFHVTIGNHSAQEICNVVGSEGRGGFWGFPDVVVLCHTPSFSVGGTVSGLNRGTVLYLVDNGGDVLTVDSNGSFAFNKALPAGTSYDVSIGRQPNHQSCTISKGLGKVASANVTSIVVSCR